MTFHCEVFNPVFITQCIRSHNLQKLMLVFTFVHVYVHTFETKHVYVRYSLSHISKLSVCPTLSKSDLSLYSECLTATNHSPVCRV